MSDFINTADVIGDDEMCDQIIRRTVTQYKDERISKVGQYAFYGCTALKEVDLPYVSNILNNSLEGCSGLEVFILRKETVVTLSNVNALQSSGISAGTGYIYVPAALVDAYKSATNWSIYAAQIRAIEDYPQITGG